MGWVEWEWCLCIHNSPQKYHNIYEFSLFHHFPILYAISHGRGTATSFSTHRLFFRLLLYDDSHHTRVFFFFFFLWKYILLQVKAHSILSFILQYYWNSQFIFSLPRVFIVYFQTSNYADIYYTYVLRKIWHIKWKRE